jgi:hypothetical protein
MKKVKMMSAVVMMFALNGCGGESSGSGSDAQYDNYPIPGTNQDLDGSWTVSIDDGLGSDLSGLAAVYGDKIYGYDDVFYGSISESSSGISLSITEQTGSHSLTIPKYYGTIYQGNYKNGSAQMIPYGRGGRDQTTIADTWENGSYYFTINESGAFTQTEESTGCLVAGTITYQTANIYLINATASACINGELDGPVTGVASVIAHMVIYGTEMKLASAHYVFENAETFTDRHVTADWSNQ